MVTTEIRGFVDNELISSRGGVYTVDVDYSLRINDVDDYIVNRACVNDEYFPKHPRHLDNTESVVIHVIRFKANAPYGHIKNLEFMPEFLGVHGFRSANLQELVALDRRQPQLKINGAYTLGYVCNPPCGPILPGLFTDSEGNAHLDNLYAHTFTPSKSPKTRGIWRVVAVPNS